MKLDEIEHEESKFNLLKRLGKPLDIEQSKLAQAGRKANILCEELRKLGIEAYEFHDRSESFVCVGAFDWVSRKDNFGGVEFNPEVEKTIMLFKGTVENMPGNQNSFAAKSLPTLEKQGIAFDVQPVPVAVPRAPGAQSQTARGGLFGAQMR
jgi:hypothetical protein